MCILITDLTPLLRRGSAHVARFTLSEALWRANTSILMTLKLSHAACKSRVEQPTRHATRKVLSTERCTVGIYATSQTESWAAHAL